MPTIEEGIDKLFSAPATGPVQFQAQPVQSSAKRGKSVDEALEELFAKPAMPTGDYAGMNEDESTRYHNALLRARAARELRQDIQSGKHKADPEGFFSSLDPSMGLIGDFEPVRAVLAMRRKNDNSYPATPQGRLARAEDEALTESFTTAGDVATARKEASSFMNRVAGTAGSVASGLPLLAAQFALTGPAASVARVGGRKLALKGFEFLSDKMLKEKAKKALPGAAAKGLTRLTGAVAATGARTALLAPHQVTANYFKEMLPEIAQTEDGELIFDETKTPEFLTAMKNALGQSFFDNLAELSGGTISKVAGGIAKKTVGTKAVKYLKAETVDRWLRLKPGRTLADFTKAVGSKTGWHGVLGELGEEELGKALKGVTGVDEYKVTTPEEFLGSGLAMSIPGGAARLAGAGLNKMAERETRKRVDSHKAAWEIIEAAQKEAIVNKDPMLDLPEENFEDVLNSVEAAEPVNDRKRDDTRVSPGEITVPVDPAATQPGEAVAGGVVDEGSVVPSWAAEGQGGPVAAEPGAEAVYFHGRKGQLSNENVIQLTTDRSAAESYAGNGGTVYTVSPKDAKTSLDFSSHSTDDMDSLVEDAVSDFSNGSLPWIEWLEGSLGKKREDIEASEVEAATRESFAPENIVVSAGAFDNVEMVNWLYEKTGKGFVRTPDGAVALDISAINFSGEKRKTIPVEDASATGGDPGDGESAWDFFGRIGEANKRKASAQPVTEAARQPGRFAVEPSTGAVGGNWATGEVRAFDFDPVGQPGGSTAREGRFRVADPAGLDLNTVKRERFGRGVWIVKAKPKTGGKAVTWAVEFDRRKFATPEDARQWFFQNSGKMGLSKFNAMVQPRTPSFRTAAQREYPVPQYEVLRKMNTEGLRYVANMAGEDSTGTRRQLMSRLHHKQVKFKPSEGLLAELQNLLPLPSLETAQVLSEMKARERGSDVRKASPGSEWDGMPSSADIPNIAKWAYRKVSKDDLASGKGRIHFSTPNEAVAADVGLAQAVEGEKGHSPGEVYGNYLRNLEERYAAEMAKGASAEDVYAREGQSLFDEVYARESVGAAKAIGDAKGEKGEDLSVSAMGKDDLVLVDGVWYRVILDEEGRKALVDSKTLLSFAETDYVSGVQLHVKNAISPYQEEAERQYWEQEQKRENPEIKPNQVPRPLTMNEVGDRDQSEKDTRQLEDEFLAQTGETVQGLCPKGSTQSTAVVKVRNTWSDRETKRQVVDLENDAGLPLGEYYLDDLTIAGKQGKLRPGQRIVLKSDPVPMGVVVAKNIMRIIRRNTGMTDVSRALDTTQRAWLKDLLSRERSVANAAYRLGRKNGWIDATQTHQQARQAAIRLKEQRAELRDLIKKINAIRKNVNRMPEALRNQVIAMVDGIDWRKMTSVRRQELAEYEVGQLTGIPPLPGMRSHLARLSKRSVTTLSIADIREMFNKLVDINKQAAEGRGLATSWKDEQIAANVQNELDTLEKKGDRPDTPQGPMDVRSPSFTKPPLTEAKKFLIESADRFSVIKEFGSAVRRIFGSLYTSADSAKAEVRQRYVTKIQKYIADHPWIMEWRDKAYTIKYKDGTEEGGSLTITNDQKIAIFMHSFNEEAYRHLENGGISFKGIAAQVYKLPKSSIEQVVQDVGQNPEEVALAEFLWNEINDNVFSEAMRVFKRLTGYDVPKVRFYLTLNAASTASTLDEVQQLDAGYVQRVYGPQAVSLDKGWQQERTGAAGPIYLTGALDQTMSHVDRMADYIGFEEWLHLANGVLTNRDVQAAIVNRRSEVELKYLDKMVRDIVDQKFNKEAIDNLGDFLNRSVTRGFLWMAPSAIMKQVSSYFTAAEKLGFNAWNPAYFTQAMKNIVFNYDAVRKYWQSRSPFLWERAVQGYSLDLQDIRKNSMLKRLLSGKRESIKEAFNRGLMSDYAGTESQKARRLWAATLAAGDNLGDLGMEGIQQMDEATVLMVAEMTRIIYMKENKIAPSDATALDEAKWTEKAEDTIRQTQSASSLIDRAQMLRARNRMVKMFTVFTSSVTKDMNALFRVLTDSTKPLHYRLTLGAMIFGSQIFTLGAIDELNKLLFGKGDDEEGIFGVKKKDAIPARIAKRATMNALYNITGPLYIANMITRGYLGWLQYGRLFPATIPAMYFAERGGQGLVDISKGDFAKGSVRLMDAATLGLLGLPFIRTADKVIAAMANLTGEKPRRIEEMVSEK